MKPKSLFNVWIGRSVIAVTLSFAISSIASLVNSSFESIHIDGVSVEAQAANCKNQANQKPRRPPAVGQKIFKRLASAATAISPEPDEKTGIAPEPNYKAGLKELKKHLGRCDDCNPAELAYMYNLAGYASYSLDDVDGAIRYYSKVVEQSPNIPLKSEQQTRYTVAQLLMVQERFKESLKGFREWEATCPTLIPADYYFMLGQIHYQVGDKKQSLSNVTRAIQMVEAKETNNVPKEGWYRLQMALNVDKEDFKAAVKVMEKVVTHYSKQNNWSQLAGLYGLVNRDKDQRAILDALNVMGLLDKKADARNYAYSLLGEEAPYQASKVLKAALKDKVIERSAKNLEILASALRQAQEVDDAIVVMEEAAKKSDKGQIYVNLAAIYLDGDKFQKSISAGKKALDKKGLRSEGEVHMYIGQSQLNLGQYSSAISSFEKARKDKRYAPYIGGLIDYAKKEKRRAEQLKKSQQEVGDA